MAKTQVSDLAQELHSKFSPGTWKTLTTYKKETTFHEHRLQSEISCSSCGYTYKILIALMAISLKFIYSKLANLPIMSLELKSITNFKVKLMHSETRMYNNISSINICIKMQKNTFPSNELLHRYIPLQGLTYIGPHSIPNNNYVHQNRK